MTIFFILITKHQRFINVFCFFFLEERNNWVTRLFLSSKMKKKKTLMNPYKHSFYVDNIWRTTFMQCYSGQIM